MTERVRDLKRHMTICCEEMLMQIGETVFLDSIQSPHLDNAITGPLLNRCPWCGVEEPIGENEDQSPKTGSAT